MLQVVNYVLVIAMLLYIQRNVKNRNLIYTYVCIGTAGYSPQLVGGRLLWF
jgi:hypothetical protein